MIYYLQWNNMFISRFQLTIWHGYSVECSPNTFQKRKQINCYYVCMYICHVWCGIRSTGGATSDITWYSICPCGGFIHKITYNRAFEPFASNQFNHIIDSFYTIIHDDCLRKFITKMYYITTKWTGDPFSQRQLDESGLSMGWAWTLSYLCEGVSQHSVRSCNIAHTSRTSQTHISGNHNPHGY